MNKHGLLQSKGLPACGVAEIQPAKVEKSCAVKE